MAATPNQCAPINMYVIQNAKWQPQEKQEEKERLTSSLLISTKTHGQALYLLVERYTGEPIYGPWFCYLGRNQGRWEYSTFLGKTVSTSVRIKNLPSIVLPYTAIDIYPKALGVVSLKYTKAKLKFVKAKCHRLVWSCRWCHLQPVDLEDAHSVSHTTWSSSLHFFYKGNPWRHSNNINTYSHSHAPVSQD